MWFFKKRRKILGAVSSIVDDVSALTDTVVELQEAVGELTKAVNELKADNKQLYEELSTKNRFIEDLLRQMIGGAVDSISGVKRETKTTILEPSKPVSKSMADYIAKKNGGLKLPG